MKPKRDILFEISVTVIDKLDNTGRETFYRWAKDKKEAKSLAMYESKKRGVFFREMEIKEIRRKGDQK